MRCLDNYLYLACTTSSLGSRVRTNTKGLITTTVPYLMFVYFLLGCEIQTSKRKSNEVIKELFVWRQNISPSSWQSVIPKFTLSCSGSSESSLFWNPSQQNLYMTKEQYKHEPPPPGHLHHSLIPSFSTGSRMDRL